MSCIQTLRRMQPPAHDLYGNTAFQAPGCPGQPGTSRRFQGYSGETGFRHGSSLQIQEQGAVPGRTSGNKACGRLLFTTQPRNRGRFRLRHPASFQRIGPCSGIDMDCGEQSADIQRGNGKRPHSPYRGPCRCPNRRSDGHAGRHQKPHPFCGKAGQQIAEASARHHRHRFECE